MTGEGWDEVRVLDQLIDVADEGTTGHVAAGDLIDRNLHLRSGHCVKLSHKIGDPSLLKDGLDADVVAFRRIERKQLVTSLPRKRGINIAKIRGNKVTDYIIGNVANPLQF